MEETPLGQEDAAVVAGLGDDTNLLRFAIQVRMCSTSLPSREGLSWQLT